MMTMPSARRLLFILGLAVAGLGGAPNAASAGTARVATAKGLNGKLLAFVSFDASAGEANRVAITSVDAKTTTVEDLGAALTPGAGCEAISVNRVRCRTPVDRSFVTSRLGDGDDTARLTDLDGTLFGGPGNDSITAIRGDGWLLRGDSGDDLLTAGEGSDTLAGSSGEDRLLGGAGEDRLDGGTGTDAIGGGTGTDTVYYRTGNESPHLFGLGEEDDRMASPVEVTLDGMPNDGAAGENDAIAGDVENVMSGVSVDQVTGDDGPNALEVGGEGGALYGAGGADTLLGPDGRDTLDGGEGDDFIDENDLNGGRSDLRGGSGSDYLLAADVAEEDSVTEEMELDPTADAISCGPGQDQVVVDVADPRPGDCEVLTLQTEERATTTGTARSEVIRGTGGSDGNEDRIKALGGDDRVTGLSGEDRIDGGSGRDVLDAGSGRDVVLARDGTRDRIRCGSGRDRVDADGRDRVARDCERVRRR